MNAHVVDSSDYAWPGQVAQPLIECFHLTRTVDELKCAFCQTGLSMSNSYIDIVGLG